MFRAFARFAVLLIALFVIHSSRAPFIAAFGEGGDSSSESDQSPADAPDDDASDDSERDSDDSDAEAEVLSERSETAQFAADVTYLALASDLPEVEPWFASREPRPGELA